MTVIYVDGDSFNFITVYFVLSFNGKNKSLV